MQRDAKKIVQCFKDFEKVSGLSVNISKTLAIPVYKCPTEQGEWTIRRSDKRRFTNCGWPNFGDQVILFNEYLGKPVGLPVTDAQVFDKPMKKLGKAIR